MTLLRCIALPLLLVCGCWFSPDEHVQACSSDEDCASGFSCYADFCIEDSDRTPPPEDGCSQVGQIESCYDGASDTEDVGVCQAGQRVCVNGTYTDCLGQVLPQIEICNAKDDDCNGSIDDVAEAACDTTPFGRMRGRLARVSSRRRVLSALAAVGGRDVQRKGRRLRWIGRRSRRRTLLSARHSRLCAGRAGQLAVPGKLQDRYPRMQQRDGANLQRRDHANGA